MIGQLNPADERYVRCFTRDTADWLSLGFEAQALYVLVRRKVDRAGVLELGKHGKRGVAIAVGHASRWETIGPALEELLADGCLVIAGARLIIPGFIEQEDTPQSDRLRQARSREKRRADALAGDVSRNVTESHAESRDVTGGHAESRDVTPSVPSVPCLPLCPVEPDQSVHASFDDGCTTVGELHEQDLARARARRKPRAVAAAEPLPFTIAALMSHLSTGSGGRIVTEPFDTGLAKPITRIIRESAAAGITLDDVKLAGEFIAATYGAEYTVGPSWVATTGKLLDAIGKARNWAASGKKSRALAVGAENAQVRLARSMAAEVA